MTRISSLLLALSLPLLAGPAVAAEADGMPPSPTQPAQAQYADLMPAIDDTVIRTDRMEAEIMSDYVMPQTRLFSRFDGQATLSRMDRAEIEAEIAARFKAQAALSRPQTGLRFDPDITMVLKPLDAPGQLRDSAPR